MACGMLNPALLEPCAPNRFPICRNAGARVSAGPRFNGTPSHCRSIVGARFTRPQATKGRSYILRIRPHHQKNPNRSPTQRIRFEKAQTRREQTPRSEWVGRCGSAVLCDEACFARPRATVIHSTVSEQRRAPPSGVGWREGAHRSSENCKCDESRIDKNSWCS